MTEMVEDAGPGVGQWGIKSNTKAASRAWATDDHGRRGQEKTARTAGQSGSSLSAATEGLPPYLLVFILLTTSASMLLPPVSVRRHVHAYRVPCSPANGAVKQMALYQTTHHCIRVVWALLAPQSRRTSQIGQRHHTTPRVGSSDRRCSLGTCHGLAGPRGADGRWD